MGYQTKVQLINRKKSKQWYIGFPAALAKAMEFEKGEVCEWIIEDKGLLALRRVSPPGPVLKKKTEEGLALKLEKLLRSARGSFGQARVFNRAKADALSVLVGFGRRTVTGMLSTCGRQFADWSADYRLFSRGRFDAEGLFDVVRRGMVEMLPDGAPVVAALDDTLLKKSGKKTPGVSYRRDPLGPPFHVNLIKAQRFIQLSMAAPSGPAPGDARMIPVDFRHAPSAKKPGKRASDEDWREYHKMKKATNLSTKGVERIQRLRQALNKDAGGDARPLHIVVDGSFTNGTVFKNLPPETVLIGRIRKDAKLYYLPDDAEQPSKGRKRVYGMRAPTPDELRADKKVKWQTVDAWAAGKVHQFQLKTIAPLRSRVAGGGHTLRLLVIRPLRYRPTKGSRLLYRAPAYIICTDPKLPLQQIIQEYAWRWDVEVNIRDEKQLIGAGQAQVRNNSSVELLPAFCVASYAMLLLAAVKTYGVNGLADGLPPPKWRRTTPKRRASTQDLINQLRAELWGKYMRFDNFSGFDSYCKANSKLEKCSPLLPSALTYSIN